MQTFKFKDKVKKKVKEFLAVTLISSSILVSNVSCDNKEDNIYGDNPIVDLEQTDKDTTNVNDKDSVVNDKDNLTDDENSDSDLTDEDELLNDEETDEDVDDENEEEIPEEDPLPINTGSKYVPSSDEIEKELENDCFDFVKLAKLIGAYCESSNKIDIETPSGKCYVPYYLISSGVKATPPCIFKTYLKDIEAVIKLGYHESAPDLFQGKIDVINIHLMHYYLSHKYVSEENIRKVVAYSHDDVSEEYKIPDFVNSFEFGESSYKMLNEHVEVLHEVEFINVDSNYHTRIRLYSNYLESLELYNFVVLDLLKCPELESKELSLAVLGFIGPKNIVNNDSKYQKHVKGECEEYRKEITDKFIKEVLGN